MSEAVQIEKRITDFLLNTENLLQTHNLANQNTHYFQKWDLEDHQLYQFYQSKKERIHQFLQDNFDTASVVAELLELILASNKYVQNFKPTKSKQIDVLHPHY